MDMIIHTVSTGGIGSDLGLVPGDRILQINDREDLLDLFDYQLEVSGSEYLEMRVLHTDGSEEIYEIEKDAEAELGIRFASPIFTPIKTCNNACPFCFIDQQPEGLRASLYVKDDDWRLSYFANTYITLTNLTPLDRRRIEMIRPGPLYISVHSTVPEVRCQLLQNKKAGQILEELRWLKTLEIPFHCQVVVCPGINDGDSLHQTLSDLATLQPEALSVAVVPVGLTQYRGHLPNLTPVDKSTAQAVIQTVETFQTQYGNDFVYLSDEFYFKAGQPLPQYPSYGDFPQLDDGVGTGRMLLEGFYNLEPALPKRLELNKTWMVLTGPLGHMILQPIITRLNEIEGLYLDLMAVESSFWGESVGVAGLITGQDILNALQATDLSVYQGIIIPSVMLKQDSELFLDNYSVSQLAETLKLPFHVVQDAYSADEFVSLVLGQPSGSC